MVAKLKNIIVPFPEKFFQHVRYLTSSTPQKQTTNTMVLFDFVSLSLSLVYFTFALEGILPVFGFIMANELDKLWSYPDRGDATGHNSLRELNCHVLQVFTILLQDSSNQYLLDTAVAQMCCCDEAMKPVISLQYGKFVTSSK